MVLVVDRAVGREHVAVVALTRIPESPNTVNHRDPISVGASRTPKTNSRTVRPREMRAMNMPTNGAQLIHQPQ